MSDSFYWRTARDSLLTERALQLFQILASREGQVFEDVKDEIDSDYTTARGRGQTERHGGLIQSYIQVFREAGWVELHSQTPGKRVIKLTPAGRQALLLLTRLPDFLKAVPAFVPALLSRYQLNNPARPETRKDQNYEQQLSNSDVFPYWTLLKIMRECDDYITVEELRRFVFRLHRSEDITNTIAEIRKFRADVADGMSGTDIDAKYPAHVETASDNQKYFMERLGTYVGKKPSVVEKEGQSKWVLNPYYLPFIDEILANAPIFQEHLTERSWMQVYGQAVPLADSIEEKEEEQLEELDEPVSDEDPIWLQLRALKDAGAKCFLLIGPPGTSKTWYARRIASKLVDRDARRVRFVQFHPSYSYEDFVEGYVPSRTESEPLFVPTAKVFLRLCEKARLDTARAYVMVIDEFNRGDPSKIFGELLTYLEPDYRGKHFHLPYSGRPMSIPDNVLIVGTMNPYDKSVSDIDDALERRFDRLPLDPNVDRLREMVIAAGMSGELIGRVVQFFNLANQRSRHGLGHALFLRVGNDQALMNLWNYRLRYLLNKQFQFQPEVFNELKTAYSSLVADATGLLS